MLGYELIFKLRSILVPLTVEVLCLHIYPSFSYITAMFENGFGVTISRMNEDKTVLVRCVYSTDHDPRIYYDHPSIETSNIGEIVSYIGDVLMLDPNDKPNK